MIRVVSSRECRTGHPPFFFVKCIHSNGALGIKLFSTPTLAATHVVREIFCVKKKLTYIFKPGNDVEPCDRIYPDRRVIAKHLVSVIGAVLQFEIEEVNLFKAARNDRFI